MVNLLKNNSLINSFFRTESDIDWSKNCKKVCDAGFEYANAIIDRCAMLYHPEGVCA